MIVRVDEQDFVISVEKEAVDSTMNEIRRSDYMPEATRVCKGPWHYNRGKGTPLPISAFPENRYKKGTITKTCGECLQKNGRRSATLLGVKPTVTPVIATPPAMAKNLEEDGFRPTNDAAMHKWEVTIIRPDVVIVYARDYLDAGVEAGGGEVVNVRRLD